LAEFLLKLALGIERAEKMGFLVLDGVLGPAVAELELAVFPRPSFETAACGGSPG
jgi:hypothetical protein